MKQSQSDLINNETLLESITDNVNSTDLESDEAECEEFNSYDFEDISLSEYEDMDNTNINDDNINITEDNINITEDNMNITEDNMNITEDNMNITEDNMNITEDNMNITEDSMNITEDSINICDNDINIDDNIIKDKNIEIFDNKFIKKNNSLNSKVSSLDEKYSFNSDDNFSEISCLSTSIENKKESIENILDETLLSDFDSDSLFFNENQKRKCDIKNDIKNINDVDNGDYKNNMDYNLDELISDESLDLKTDINLNIKSDLSQSLCETSPIVKGYIPSSYYKNFKNKKNENKMVESGFQTGNKKKIEINQDLLFQLKFAYENQENNEEISNKGNENQVEEKNKEENIDKNQEFLYKENYDNISDEKQKEIIFKNPEKSDNKKLCDKNQKSSINKCKINIFRKGNKKIKIENENYNELCLEYFQRIFKETGYDKRWLKIQYKWAWILAIMKNKIDFEFIKSEIKKRKENEYSPFKRIIEGDDIPGRYLVVGVISIDKNRIEIYDGFYSIFVEVDRDILKKIVSQKLKIGDKIRIIFSEKICEKRDIFEIIDKKISVLKIFNNSVLIGGRKIDYQKKCCFMVPLKHITRGGGPISCVELQINEILERKIYIKINNFKMVVDEKDYEFELEKIEEKIKKHDVVVEDKKLSKFVICRANDHFKITVWNYEIKENCIYMFLNLKVEPDICFHLTTTPLSVIKEKNKL